MDIKTAAALHRLRLASIPEALSFPALLIFGTGFRIFLGYDKLVMPLGLLHGILFTIFLVLLLDAWNRTKWPFKRVAFFFLLAVLPFGGLYADKVLKREEEAGVIAARARREGTVNA
ncbi:hypothetical protein ADL22_29495 [Streptomyces sp. NRRL F-4489]|uniref:DUF3817 domain-containing protein n=1 Tax=Streptomyces TaxID=1883 RepID=UPI0007492BA1|nr:MULTISPECIES: DUF3817 domain-containing protein [Streptomyces]KUL34881.1 hypothetical protein ADL22_29495 [Streptomyces sp. NRRL F-4489]MCK7627678.1 DUF3817 domain-containing protein [Streptomyces rhizoryzae]QZL03992.1 DUF3817 domain-containing protein [Streptomyces sp. BHT-5-2]